MWPDAGDCDGDRDDDDCGVVKKTACDGDDDEGFGLTMTTGDDGW